MTHTCALLKGLICLVSKVTGTGIASGQTSLSSAGLTLLCLQEGIAPMWKRVVKVGKKRAALHKNRHPGANEAHQAGRVALGNPKTRCQNIQGRGNLGFRVELPLC